MKYIQAMRNFWAIVKYIKQHREERRSYFKVLTTQTEIILIATDFPEEETKKHEQLRIKY